MVRHEKITFYQLFFFFAQSHPLHSYPIFTGEMQTYLHFFTPPAHFLLSANVAARLANSYFFNLLSLPAIWCRTKKSLHFQTLLPEVIFPPNWCGTENSRFQPILFSEKYIQNVCFYFCKPMLCFQNTLCKSSYRCFIHAVHS